jgi:uncharacterized protein YkuJ
MVINTNNTVSFTQGSQDIARVFVGGYRSENTTLTDGAHFSGLDRNGTYTVHIGFEKTGENNYTVRYFWGDEMIPAYTIEDVEISAAEIFDNGLGFAVSSGRVTVKTA